MKKMMMVVLSCILLSTSLSVLAKKADEHIVRQKQLSIGSLQQMRAASQPSARSAGVPAPTEIPLQLFDGRSIVLVQSKIVERSANDFSWFGHVQGKPDSLAILVVKNGKITGQIQFSGEHYEINPTAGNLHKLSKVDVTKLPDLEDDVLHSDDLPSGNALSPHTHSSTEDGNTSFALTQNAGTSAETIDLLGLYTLEAAQNYPDVEARIQLAVDYTNTVYENSQIPVHVNLVATIGLDHNETTTNAENIWMSDPFDGRMEEVDILREQYSADVVSLWAYFIQGACGRASAILGTVVSASHVTRVSCGGQTFAHELGHNQGARHNMEEDSSLTPFAYGHGTGSSAGQWRTIMSYVSACSPSSVCTRIPYFSTPNLTYAGEVIGDASRRDNARVITETAAQIADYSNQMHLVDATTMTLVTDDGSVSIDMEELFPGTWIGTGTHAAGVAYRWQLSIDGQIYGPINPPLTLGQTFTGRMSADSNSTIVLRSFSDSEFVVLFDERYQQIRFGRGPLTEPSLYVRGTPNNFDTSTPMTHLGWDLWVATMTFTGAANDRFKLDVHGDWTRNYGFDNATQKLTLGGDDILVPEAGSYKIYVDMSNKEYWLAPVTTGNQSPIADAGSDTTVAVGQSVTLDGSASHDPDGTIVEYVWEELNLTGATVATTFNTVGTHTITLRVTDDEGATATDTITVNVTSASTWQRTVIFMYGQTDSGQDMFIRGGIDHDYAANTLGRTCTASNYECAIPIVHRNLLNGTTASWKAKDDYLDWYGLEAGQSGGEGTALDWTTDVWPSSWGTVRTVDVDGYGETPLNIWGEHYWMLDVDMDCSATANGWFELKSFVSNGPGWEADVQQPNAPWQSGNHFAECGKMNVFARGQSAPIAISALP